MKARRMDGSEILEQARVSGVGSSCFALVRASGAWPPHHELVRHGGSWLYIRLGEPNGRDGWRVVEISPQRAMRLVKLGLEVEANLENPRLLEGRPGLAPLAAAMCDDHAAAYRAHRARAAALRALKAAPC